jgi:HAD superfamily hydrolase (TIGR01509 family)
MVIKYVLFDCWDTVIHFALKEPYGNLKAIYKHVVNKRRLPLETFEEEFDEFMHAYYRDTVYEVKEEEIFAYLIEKHDTSLDCSYEQACLEAGEAFDVSPIDGLRDFLKWLDSRKIEYSVLSNSVQSQAETASLINKVYPEKPFSLILSSAQYAVKKPDPRFFQLAAVKLHVKPENVLFIGDNIYTDIKGAAAANMNPIYFNWKGHIVPQDGKLDTLKYKEITSYADLINYLEDNPDYVI